VTGPAIVAGPTAERWLPSLRTARAYRAGWLRHDLFAGLVLTAVLVPAGMGYAEAAGLPAVNGLYATIAALVAYAVVGPSRIVILGPDSALTPLIAAAVLPLAGADPSRAAVLAAALAVLSGLLCIAAGLARFGYLTDLLSLPVRYGYLNGIALLILVGQLPKLCGFSTDADGLIDGVGELVRGLADGKANSAALAFGVGALGLVLVTRRVAPRVPAMLLAVAAGIGLATVLGLGPDDLPLVGELPQGLPGFAVPDVRLGDLSALLAGAAGVAIVSFADTSVLSRTFATRGGYDAAPNHELVALGLTNTATGLFRGFPVSASISRTPVAEAAGARTQLTGLVGAAAVVALLLWLPDLFRNLPSSVLAAVVIAAALGLIEVRGVAHLARTRPSEMVVSLVATASIAVVGVIAGIGIAIGVSLVAFIRRAWAPHSAELVRVDGLKGYHDHQRHPEGHRVPGLALFRFDAPLFFANAEAFKRRVLAAVVDAGRAVDCVVITAEPMTDIDATGASALGELLDELERRRITLAFAELKGRVRERLDRFGLVDRIGPAHFYRTVGEAVRAYVSARGVEWTDWEDRTEEMR
jgi:high affinity sulfate transporter 1